MSLKMQPSLLSRFIGGHRVCLFYGLEDTRNVIMTQREGGHFRDWKAVIGLS